MFFLRKKFFKEVQCKACDGSGKATPIEHKITVPGKHYNRFDITAWIYQMKAAQGCCFACNSKGTQTVLERVE